MKRSPQGSPRVLLVRTGAMGDVLHALPAVAALRHLCPEITIDWVVDPRWAPLLVDAAGRGPLVSAVHLAETRLWSQTPLAQATLRSILHLRRSLLAGQYTHVVDVQGSLRSATLGRFAAASQAGFADPRERAARLLYRQTFARRGMHVVEQNAALLGQALGTNLTPEAVQLAFHPDAESWANNLLGTHPIALLTPAAGWGAKQWPAERFGQLATTLKATGFQVLVNAASAHDPVALATVQASHGAAAPVTCNIAQLVALTRRATVVVGGDTGPVHLAAALGRPLVALFGPTDPARNGPWGTGPIRILRDSGSVTTYKRTPQPDAGLAQITVDAVAEAVRAVASMSL